MVEKLIPGIYVRSLMIGDNIIEVRFHAYIATSKSSKSFLHYLNNTI
jgi:hypothetical protein